jgi:hypothetical protein
MGDRNEATTGKIFIMECFALISFRRFKKIIITKR